MLFSSTKFLGGKNIQNITTLTFKRSSGSGLGEFFDRVDIVDPKGYTKLGTGSNFSRSSVISGTTFGGSVPVELNPATYSIRVKNAFCHSAGGIADNLDGEISIRVARMNEMNTQVHLQGDTQYEGQLTDTDNELLDGTNKWLFEEFTVGAGTSNGWERDTGSGGDATFPFVLVEKMPISFAQSERVGVGGNQTDDASMSIFAFFDVPTTGSPMSARLELEIVEGFEFD